ncbi:hypothetical protein GCM10027176_32160 [Actinoallomurus bryophytorum]|uniref:DUF6924 domain-containing protein n=1 Tax=Actinoallomurus bryophytorum TaxID=1490222 RepID=A0A543BT50_9ACTN|nr:hypothetical protein [Actinoallomurus bryophytorum]TQL88013.1 hypothetical protein FB559_8625 [Actinoallomurus bryophytorum]
MTTLPKTVSTPLLRTDFSDETAWEALLAAIATPNEDGFMAYVDSVEDPAHRDLTLEQVLALVPAECEHPILIVADHVALTSPEMPLLVIDLWDERGRVLRVVVEELSSIENNLSISNMDFDDFTAAADEHGVFRGF